jgi:hypothetical protein
LPIYRISAAGESARIATLVTIAPDWLWYDDLEQPSSSREFYSLPWFLTDMRPQGYLGRLFPLRYDDLALPDSIGNWTEDHALYALARRGEDMAGNLVIGDESLARWLALTDARNATDPADRLPEYARLAEETLAGKVAGSSAAGEQPKFTAELGVSIDDARHVLVKFSPSMDTPAGRRWADLLHAEHIASNVLREHGHVTVVSRCFSDERRTYLEVERFDRIGAGGRVGVVSLGSIDDEFVGQRAGWAQSGAALLRAGLVSADDVRELRWLAAFGLLIGNTDMHLGNAAFLHDGQLRLRLAPVYDMLPMLYAPIRGEVLERRFSVPKPPPYAADQWRAAFSAAGAYWRAVADDARISKEFRSIAARNAATVRG